MVDLVRENLPKVRELCVRYGVQELQLFGSAMGDEFDLEKSDIDLIVVMPEHDIKSYWGLLKSLESLFGRKVDLLEKAAIKNPYMIRAIKANRETLFAA